MKDTEATVYHSPEKFGLEMVGEIADLMLRIRKLAKAAS
jgi:hypothetical protein